MDLSLGVDILTAGPFEELYEKNFDAYYIHLTRNLIVFQFGFLGAYIYFIGSIARAYFTLDLTSHTFVDGAIRMIVASILALVVSFAIGPFLPDNVVSASPLAVRLDNHSASSPSTAIFSQASTDLPAREGLQDGESGSAPRITEQKNTTIPASLSLLTAIAFFFGFYPRRALLAIEKTVLKAMSSIMTQ